MITLNLLSRILHRNDPMNTTCTSNKGMENEYDDEALEIIELLKQGVPFKQAYFSVMSHSFWTERALQSYSSFAKIELSYYQHKT